MGRRNGKGRDEGCALEWNRVGLITHGTHVLPPDNPGMRNGLTQISRYAKAEIRLPTGEKGAASSLPKETMRTGAPASARFVSSKCRKAKSSVFWEEE